MSQKTEKPSLSGQRLKTRKRDEKEKYDVILFRDTLLQGLTEAGTDLDHVSKYLDSAGNRLDYRRYAEPLLDILIAGGLLAPGGTLITETEGARPHRATVCVFTANSDHTSLKAHYAVLYKLIRRYKYVEKAFEEELKKLIMFLRGFTLDEREKLARLTGICLANSLGNSSCLLLVLEDHLVKDGLALEFATRLFDSWLKERDISNVASTLRRGGVEGKLMNLFPINKRTQENFENHFKAAGLNQIVEYQRAKATVEQKKELQKEVEEMIMNETPIKEITAYIKEQHVKTGMSESEICVMVWNSIMGAVEWNKKEEVVAEQSLKHLKAYSPLLASLTTSAKAEMAVLQKIQDYCYDNMNFMKVFQKIVVLFYKTDVISEDVILRWYRESHSTKGKSVFLQQMKSFVEWLENAEEESEGEDA